MRELNMFCVCEQVLQLDTVYLSLFIGPTGQISKSRTRQLWSDGEFPQKQEISLLYFLSARDWQSELCDVTKGSDRPPDRH